MDLSLVRLVRAAMRNADLAAGCRGGDLLIGDDRCCHRRRCHLHPEPAIEPRRHIYPTDVYEPREVIHPHPRVEQQVLACPPCYTAPPPPAKTPNPIQPPWKVMPWENPPQTRQTVKVHCNHTDVSRKGSVLDLFV